MEKKAIAQKMTVENEEENFRKFEHGVSLARDMGLGVNKTRVSLLSKLPAKEVHRFMRDWGAFKQKYPKK